MTVRHVSASRRHEGGLLARPPCTAGARADRWADLVVDPARQLVVLVDLMRRGLISREQFDRLVARLVLDVTEPGGALNGS